METPDLLTACKEGNDKKVRVLIASKADLELKNNNGCTPLIVAAKAGHYKCLVLLIDAGVNQDAIDENGYTARTWSAKKSHKQCLKLLLDTPEYKSPFDFALEEEAQHITKVNTQLKALRDEHKAEEEVARVKAEKEAAEVARVKAEKEAAEAARLKAEKEAAEEAGLGEGEVFAVGDQVHCLLVEEDNWYAAEVVDVHTDDAGVTTYDIKYEGFDDEEAYEYDKPGNEVESPEEFE